ncbi:MAG: aminotransferase class I/II-fold pyridoxal phosphate-dependent enzyme, partial [Clostridia bacterium]|nr:aminotransferase class I/II-fold pyridoxal phosphate-dependent enzyme [Clostridia bacterium]
KDDNYTKKNCLIVEQNRQSTERELEKLGFTMTNSSANFLFAKHSTIAGKEIYQKLKEKGVLIRHFDKERLKDYNRITIVSKKQMKVFIEKLNEVLKELL